jgi:hypothetical protein
MLAEMLGDELVVRRKPPASLSSPDREVALERAATANCPWTARGPIYSPAAVRLLNHLVHPGHDT